MVEGFPVGFFFFNFIQSSWCCRIFFPLEYWYCYANYYSNLLHCVGRLAIIHNTSAIGVHAPMRVMLVQVVNTGLVV